MVNNSEARYDRQLRLWGSHGQRRLGVMRVLVFGSSIVATETLKNLVLPGIGHFTVADDALVSVEDLGHNFFLEETDVGCPRAVCVVARIKELNPDVSGCAIVQPLKSCLSDSFLSRFDIIILADSAVPQITATQLCESCERLEKVFVFVRSSGFIGLVRIYVKEHTIIESKPDAETRQLWISEPFKELEEYCISVCLDNLANVEHAHVPYIVLLVQACKSFQEKNDGKLPTLKDIDEIKLWLNEKRRSVDEQNFVEALTNARIACQRVVLSPEIVSILEEAERLDHSALISLCNKQNEGQELTTERFCFWITAKAIAQFVKSTGKPPCAGSIPDLTASTERFVALQQIYQTRCKENVGSVLANIDNILEELTSVGPVETIRRITRCLNHEYVEIFCKNILDCRCVRYRSLFQELTLPIPEQSRDAFDDDEDSHDTSFGTVPKVLPINWYILWQAVDQWQTEKQTDIQHLKASIVPKILKRMGVESFTNIHEDFFAAVPLFAEKMELHAPASMVAAIAAQEVIKLCTGQFLPINNTFIWDGYSSRGCAVEL